MATVKTLENLLNLMLSEGEFYFDIEGNVIGEVALSPYEKMIITLSEGRYIDEWKVNTKFRFTAPSDGVKVVPVSARIGLNDMMRLSRFAEKRAGEMFLAAVLKEFPDTEEGLAEIEHLEEEALLDW